MPKSGAEGETVKVLLAEDEPDVQLIARLSLKKAGFTVLKRVSKGEYERQ